MKLKNGPIQGVVVGDLVKHTDKRGWLMELFREDEIEKEFLPAMSYVSSTEPGVARGPHEHKDQADLFCFVGPSTFRVYLWDNRKQSPTYLNTQVLEAGEGSPRWVLIPAGVVHAYKNIGAVHGWVFNFPNRLYAGERKKEPVDEIRHESDPNTIFKLDE
ncbi:MAG TPA: dTDP-4-dehydrorhamnose 3,5-epimerase [Bacteroidetes bacterium]|nr:dTDP-4-dehydrorhamnose 3,5-epimerase [Bacteroidota bacterium]